MITTNLTGNLGNHMWQYAVCRMIAEHKGYDWGINPTPSHDYFNGKSQMEFMEMDYGKPVEGIINSFYERWIYIQHVDLVNIAMLDKRIYDIDDNTILLGDNGAYGGLFQCEDYLIDRKSEVEKWFSIKPEYKIVGKQYYTIGTESYLLAAMGITNPNDFHMSSGSMNIGLFQYEGDRWNRIDLVKNVAIPSGFGGHGELENIEVFGPKNICVSVSGGYMAQGNIEEQRVVVGVVDNSLKVIYSGQKSMNDEGAGGTEDKETRISFKK